MVDCSYIYAHKDYNKIRWLCYKVKNEQNINIAAYIMSKIIPQNVNIIPMPSHLGFSNWSLKLCKEIIKLRNDLNIFDCLYEIPNEGVCESKKYNKQINPDIVVRYGYIVPSNAVLIDNVYDTGSTYNAACEAIGKKIPIVVLGKTLKN